jgi:hypothetical protein
VLVGNSQSETNQLVFYATPNINWVKPGVSEKIWYNVPSTILSTTNSAFFYDPAARLAAVKSDLSPEPYQMYVHSKEESRWVSKFIAEKGVWHPGPSYWLKDLLAMYPGQAFQKPVVVDVGANIGWFTLLSAANGAQVFAFEPMNYNFELLKASMHLNPIFDIWLIQAALSDEASSEYICMRPQISGDPSTDKDNEH